VSSLSHLLDPAGNNRILHSSSPFLAPGHYPYHKDSFFFLGREPILNRHHSRPDVVRPVEGLTPLEPPLNLLFSSVLALAGAPVSTQREDALTLRHQHLALSPDARLLARRRGFSSRAPSRTAGVQPRPAVLPQTLTSVIPLPLFPTVTSPAQWTLRELMKAPNPWCGAPFAPHQCPEEPRPSSRAAIPMTPPRPPRVQQGETTKRFVPLPGLPHFFFFVLLLALRLLSGQRGKPDMSTEGKGLSRGAFFLNYARFRLVSLPGRIFFFYSPLKLL